MKNHIHLAVVRLLSAVLCGTAISSGAAVPVRWTAETSRVQPIALDAWRGDTLALECTLKSYGQPVALGAATASLMWQTNGMGSAWWQTNATVSSDGVIRATWSPSMDPGAPAVAFFLPVQTGDGASYRAAGTLRFRPSPGAGSQIAQLPQPGGTLDFGEFNLVNAPWATLAAANEAISAAVTSATGALVIPPAVDLSPYATTGYVQNVSTALSNDIQLAINSSSNYTDQVASGLSSSITSATNSLGSVLRDNIAESAAATHSYADSVASNAQAYADGVASNAQRAAIAAIPSLAGYATETYVESAISAITIPSLAGYATTAYADAASSNAQAAAIAAIPSLSGYATQAFVADYFAATYTPPDLSSYASRSYADAAASNAQAAAIAAIPSLAGYATETYVESAISAIFIPSLAGYATTAYADAAASNAQRAAIAAIPSLAGYATETYAQNAAESAASDALSAAQTYARDLSWVSSQGNTRLVSLDGFTWQDATGTVWQVSYVFGWSGTVVDLATSAARPIAFYYAGTTTTAPTTTSPTDYWTAGGGTNLYFDSHTALSWELWMTNDYHGMTNGSWQPVGTPTPPSTATNLSFNTAYELYTLFYQPVALATNPVDHVLYEGGTVNRALTVGTSTRWTDANGCVWEVSSRWVCTDPGAEWTYTIDGETYTHAQMVERADSEDYSQTLEWLDTNFETPDGGRQFEGWYVLDGSGTAPVGYDFSTDTIPDYASDPLLAHVTYYGNITATRGSLVTVTNLITRVAYTNETAPLVEAVTNLQVESALVYRLYSGSNVVAEVTNYNSQVHAPELRLMQLNESNEYVTVWTETNGLSRTLATATKYTDDATNALPEVYAPRAWSRTTSGLGADVPDGETWITTPKVYVTGGLEYHQTIDAYGAVWVLCSNGMTPEYSPDTNAYFRISADDGTPIFSIEKTDAMVVGANAAGITVGESSIVIPVPVVSPDPPTMYWRQHLDSGDWADESSPPTGSTVTWTGEAGARVCTISFSGTRPSSLFFRFTFLQPGGVVIRNKAITDLSQGIIVNGTNYVPTVSGNNLIWTKQ